MGLPRQANSLDLGGSISDPAGQRLDLTMLSMLSAAIGDTGTPLKVIALSLGVDPGYLTRMLSGQKPFPLSKVEALPDHVERAFVKRYAESLGFTVEEDSTETKVIGHLLSALGAAFGALQRLPEKRARMEKMEMGR